MKYKEITPKKQYVIRLVRDEDVLATLTDFCAKEGIEHAHFNAIGAMKESTIGFYDLAKKEYGKKNYADEMEVASMIGNVALVDGKPFIHTHCVLSGIVPGTENQPIGGHVFAAKVAVTLEVYMTVYTEPVSRALDEEIGLKLLQC